MSFNGKQKKHIRERVRKGAAILGQVWGLGKRRFGEWAKRIWLFDKLVWSVLSYRVEIWGWKERDGIEMIQDRYLRWLMGVERHVPGYLLREELQRDKLRGRVGMRAWKYERKLEEGRGGELARACWKEMRSRAREGKVMGEWEEERRKFMGERGWKIEEVERIREVGMLRGEELYEREKRRQREERWEKIRTSRFNNWYGRVKGEDIPGYLKKNWGERDGKGWLDLDWEMI